MYGQNLRGTALTAVITITAGFGFLLFGYDQGVFSGLLSTQAFVTQFNNPNSMVQGQIVSSYDLGCLFGAVMMLFVGDKLGRKRSIALGCVIVIVGAALQCTSFSLPHLIVARIITGLGTGANTTVIPLWQSELAQAHNRGKLIGFSLVVVTLGLVVANLINLFMTWAPQDNSVTWRFPLAFQMVFALVTLVLLLFTPESPRWLALRDRFDEANAIIARTLDKADDDVLVQQNLQQIIDTVQHERELQKPGMREIFSGGRPQTFRRIVLGASASFMQQVGGTNVIGYYLSILLVDSFGFSSRMALVLSVVDFISFSAWTLLGSFLLDRVGRKTLFLIGALGQGVCFAMAAVGLGVGGKAMNGFAVAFIFAFYIFQVRYMLHSHIARSFAYLLELDRERPSVLYPSSIPPRSTRRGCEIPVLRLQLPFNGCSST